LLVVVIIKSGGAGLTGHDLGRPLLIIFLAVAVSTDHRFSGNVEGSVFVVADDFSEIR